jgi:hypothetical protein
MGMLRPHLIPRPVLRLRRSGNSSTRRHHATLDNQPLSVNPGRNKRSTLPVFVHLPPTSEELDSARDKYVVDLEGEGKELGTHHLPRQLLRRGVGADASAS